MPTRVEITVQEPCPKDHPSPQLRSWQYQLSPLPAFSSFIKRRMTLFYSPRTVHRIAYNLRGTTLFHLSDHRSVNLANPRGKTMTTSASTMPIPILLIGATTQVGSVVSSHLKPEYEVIHFMQSMQHAKTVIPQILLGHDKPETGNDEVGSLNFSSKPQAVVLGGAFDLETVEDLRAHVNEKSAGNSVSWLVRGPDADARMGAPGPGYAAKAVGYVKGVLDRLVEQELLGKDEVHFW